MATLYLNICSRLILFHTTCSPSSRLSASSRNSFGVVYHRYLSTDLPSTYLPTYIDRYRPIYDIPTYWPTNRPAYRPTYWPTNLPAYRPTYLRTYYLSTDLPIYLSTDLLPVYCKSPRHFSVGFCIFLFMIHFHLKRDWRHSIARANNKKSAKWRWRAKTSTINSSNYITMTNRIILHRLTIRLILHRLTSRLILHELAVRLILHRSIDIRAYLDDVLKIRTSGCWMEGADELTWLLHPILLPIKSVTVGTYVHESETSNDHDIRLYTQ